MGLLSEGSPMEWEDMVAWQAHVRLQFIIIIMIKITEIERNVNHTRKYGVEQFIRLYNRLKVEKYLLSFQYRSGSPCFQPSSC